MPSIADSMWWRLLAFPKSGTDTSCCPLGGKQSIQCRVDDWSEVNEGKITGEEGREIRGERDHL